MPVMTDQRRAPGKTAPVTSPYNKPPTYSDPDPNIPIAPQMSIVPNFTPEQTANFTQMMATMPFAQPPPAAPGAAAAPAAPEPPKYDDMLAQYLGGVFGEGRSFAPMAQQITGQRDEALGSLAERMASRGMGSSGLLDTGAADIFSQSGKNLASAYQDWRSGGIQEMQGALAPFIQQQLAKEMLDLSTAQKMQLADYQSQLLMKQMFGSDYDPTMGASEYEFMAGLAGKGEPEDEMARAIEKWVRGQYPELFLKNPNLAYSNDTRR